MSNYMDRYAGSLLQAKGRANENLVRKVSNVLQQKRAKGKAEYLIVTVGFQLSVDGPVTDDQCIAVAKLCSELRKGPLKSLKSKADYYEKAEAFLQSKEGKEWISGWFQPYTPTKGDNDALGTLERSSPQGQDGARQRACPKSKNPIMPSDARSTAEELVAQGRASIEQPTQSISHVETRNDNETYISPRTVDVDALVWHIARLSSEMDQRSITSSSGRSIPAITRSDGMGVMAMNSTILPLPEPLQPWHRRRLSESQIQPCVRCGMHHLRPFSIIVPTPIAAPISGEPAMRVQSAEIKLEGRGWTKERVLMAGFLLAILVLLIDPLTRATSK